MHSNDGQTHLSFFLQYVVCTGTVNVSAFLLHFSESCKAKAAAW